ncbi:hypothetical protein D3C72_2504420 [compost metagenome]
MGAIDQLGEGIPQLVVRHRHHAIELHAAVQGRVAILVRLVIRWLTVGDEVSQVV